MKRKSNDQVFHDERGYLLWDAENKTIIQSFTIPRGVAIVAGCLYVGDPNAKEVTFELHASEKGDWNIAQSPFMRDNAKTTSFMHLVKVYDNKLHYTETMMLDIYGRDFEHTDENTLTKK